MTPAGFWVRGGAFVIDGLFIFALTLAVSLSGLTRALGFQAGVLFSVGLPFFYHAVMMAVSGRTVGKMAAGVVVRRLDGAPLTPGRAVGRAAAMQLSAFTMGLGYIVGAFTPGKRALHDYVAGTQVVYVAPIGQARAAVMALLASFVVLLPIAGAVAAFSLPNFLKFQGRARESMTRTNLAMIRTALQVQKAESGEPPESLQKLVEQKALSVIPVAHTQRHPSHAGTKVYGAEACGMTGPVALEDSGGWGYVYAPGSFCHGKVFVDCSHEDETGKRWAEH